MSQYYDNGCLVALQDICVLNIVSVNRFIRMGDRDWTPPPTHNYPIPSASIPWLGRLPSTLPSLTPCLPCLPRRRKNLPYLPSCPCLSHSTLPHLPPVASQHFAFPHYALCPPPLPVGRVETWGGDVVLHSMLLTTTVPLLPCRTLTDLQTYYLFSSQAHVFWTGLYLPPKEGTSSTCIPSPPFPITNYLPPSYCSTCILTGNPIPQPCTFLCLVCPCPLYAVLPTMPFLRICTNPLLLPVQATT